ARRAVADFVVLRLRDFDEHLRGRVLDLDLLEDRDPVVRDRHVAKGVDEHLVHALRSQGRLDRVCDRARRGDVVVHRAFSLLALGPFLQDNNWLTAHHENSRGSIRGLLYESSAGRCCPTKGLSGNLTKLSRGGGCKVTRGSVRHGRLLCDPGSGRLCLHPRVTPFLSVSPVRLLRLCSVEKTKGPSAEATVERSPQFSGVEIPCK